MEKQNQLGKWLWKWHIIAGLISLPFILLLAITGGIYLFKTAYEEPIYREVKEVQPTGSAIPFEEQRNIAIANAPKKPDAMILPKTSTEATAFTSGRFGRKTSIYINPYTSSVSGHIIPQQSLMYKVRKLHGELLLGKFGTTLVELVASWMIVLLLTGLYLKWPIRGRGIKALFVPRTKKGKRLFLADLHGIIGFWFSGLLLLVLAGGLPWTDTFGTGFKWVQNVTNTGFPAAWQGQGLQSEIQEKPLSLDAIVAKTKTFQLPGEVRMQFPKGKNGVYSITNTYPKDLTQQQSIHLDAYSGEPIVQQKWDQVGILMRGRMWVMAFHQGEFGPWNWWLMLVVAIMLALLSLSALGSYALRKKKGSWSLPKVPEGFVADKGILILIVLLGILVPLFGVSVVMLYILDKLWKLRGKRSQDVEYN